MRFFTDALSVQILEHLNRGGEVQRKSLYVPFSQYNYNYYARILRRLITENYVETVTRNRATYIRLTPKGIDAIKANGGIVEKQAKPYDKKAQRRLALVTDAVSMCKANDFRTEPEEKPELEELYTRPVSESVIDFFKTCVNDGVFYSSRELRSAYTAVMGNNEIANWTRLIGVILYKGNLSFLYSTGDKLIKWMPSNEERTVKFIADFLFYSDTISSLITRFPYPSCIICGKGYTMIPKIVMGRRWGRIETDDKFTERSRAHIAKSHINSHNLAKVFASAYYVPVGINGVQSFRLAAALNDPKKNLICNDWFSKNDDFATRSLSKPLYQGMTVGNRETVIFSPYIDLIELEMYRKQGEPAHFILPKGTQEAVARVMGPQILSANTINWEPLSYHNYDIYGAAVDAKKGGEAR